ncbi:TPA: helix-turn-helix domain-containing protein [Candidatus Poribacteria bacterium]|nr:helix-turn-helix domain-containing protein [Candidatus Poribacteria bacterium]HIB91200.1 helix-turn-helix domain-containing protein [Candidatus Poribacteria bacterium]HIC03721.1 helix-turn-helix domain-containing protein [Candidatus Poribacteria bacterium]HIM09826.1 helix-turn-helix domain-containing protein [Candidatus Poribacteria bacterium]HIN31266.1 helix-turn-helix domain-containing protein [Candidatus Poribacteria bacterium]
MQLLTWEQRYGIYSLLKTGYNQSMIANVIGVHKSTISRELRRNRGYQYKQALSSVPPPGCRMRRCF